MYSHSSIDAVTSPSTTQVRFAMGGRRGATASSSKRGTASHTESPANLGREPALAHGEEVRQLELVSLPSVLLSAVEPPRLSPGLLSRESKSFSGCDVFLVTWWRISRPPPIGLPVTRDASPRLVYGMIQQQLVTYRASPSISFTAASLRNG